MLLNEYGIIAKNHWIKLRERFQNFELYVFQIMPNHMHGIIFLKDIDDKNDVNTKKTIFDIMGVYKSLVANDCLKIYKSKKIK